MADYRTAPTVGARIAAARKARGFKSTKDLADAIPGDSITGSILQNIEAGRKNDLAVAQLLNIAWALGVSPTWILAPIGSPAEHIDLPNIIPEIRDLTVAEFDAWLSGNIDGAYMPETSDEHNDRIQLAALRELLKEQRELQRLAGLKPAYTQIAEDPVDDEAKEFLKDTEQRTVNATRRIAQLEKFLASAGWPEGNLAIGFPPHARR
jgi:transcriptional regulator with XRE-family HTH domain